MLYVSSVVYRCVVCICFCDVLVWCGVVLCCVALCCVEVRCFLLRLVCSDLISALCEISNLIVLLRDIVSCVLCCSVCVALSRFVLFVVHCIFYGLCWSALFRCAFSNIHVVSIFACCVCVCWFALFSVVVRCLVPCCLDLFCFV